MDADFALMLSLVGYIHLAAFSGVGERRRVHLLVTPDAVAEDEFEEAWEQRFAQSKETVADMLRAQLRRRREHRAGRRR